jgi:TRAP-type C4-dicarboxylate transport system substrate-binding protein
MVKDKLKELRLEMAGEFKNNYKTLLAKLKEKNIEVSELEKQLPNIFWDIRNKVVHEGYSPTPEELEIITKYIEKILTLLISLK